jgi:hypothetical protein
MAIWVDFWAELASTLNALGPSCKANLNVACKLIILDFEQQA